MTMTDEEINELKRHDEESGRVLIGIIEARDMAIGNDSRYLGWGIAEIITDAFDRLRKLEAKLSAIRSLLD